MLDKISRIIGHNDKLKRIQKPLEAAAICEAARSVASGRFGIQSFKNGLLTLEVTTSAAAANLHAQQSQIIDEINKKLGKDIVEKVRFKIV